MGNEYKNQTNFNSQRHRGLEVVKYLNDEKRTIVYISESM